MPPAIFHNPVDQVVAKLRNSRISKALLKKTNEQLRILETRIAVGKLGRLDRREVRAAIVLEYIVRQHGHVRLSLKELAGAVGMKQKNFNELHGTIGNYLQPTHQVSTIKRKAAPANVPSKTQKQALQQQQKWQQQGSSKRPKLRSTEERRSIIPNLAIRLVSHIADPHGLSKKAQALMDDIQNYLETLPAHERRGWVYDMQRYGPAYEAATFYCCQQGVGNSKSSSNRNNDTDEDAGRSLQLEDLLEASNQFTYLQLKEVLPHVKELAAKVKEHKSKQPSVDQAPSSESTTASLSGGKKKPNGPLKSNKNNVIVLDDDNLERAANTKQALDDEEDIVEHQQEASFQAWKEQTLAQAREKARQALGETMEAGEITDNELLQRAADGILQKYGLLTA